MTIQKAVSTLLITTTLMSSASTAFAEESALLSAIAAARGENLAESAIDSDKAGIPAAVRMLRPLLRKVAATGVFDTEEGKTKLFEAIAKGLERSREAALRNLDRMSDQKIRKEVEIVRRRALKDGNRAVVGALDALLANPDGVLKEKLRALHSPEKEAQFVRRIKDAVAKSGSVKQAIEDLDYCWDYYPAVTEWLLQSAYALALLCLIPGLAIVCFPALLITLALVPVGAVIDYVVIFPFYFFIDILPCEINNGATSVTS